MVAIPVLCPAVQCRTRWRVFQTVPYMSYSILPEVCTIKSIVYYTYQTYTTMQCKRRRRVVQTTKIQAQGKTNRGWWGANLSNLSMHFSEWEIMQRLWICLDPMICNEKCCTHSELKNCRCQIFSRQNKIAVSRSLQSLAISIKNWQWGKTVSQIGQPLHLACQCHWLFLFS